MRPLRVLNTRPREQAAELSRLLWAAGFEPIEAPAIAIVPEDLSVVAGTYAWVVLASANAGRGLDLHDVRVLCGSATARALGLDHAETLDHFSAEAALAAMRPKLTPGQRVLVPRAAEGRDELVDGLRALGALVDAPIAYRTVAAPDAAECLARGDIDVVALCSPSSVQAIAHVVSPQVRVACIGETTASAARAIGLRVDAVATETSMAALVSAIEGLVGARA